MGVNPEIVNYTTVLLVYIFLFWFLKMKYLINTLNIISGEP